MGARDDTRATALRELPAVHELAGALERHTRWRWPRLAARIDERARAVRAGR